MKTLISAATFIFLLTLLGGRSAHAARPQAKATTKAVASATHAKSVNSTKVATTTVPAYAPMRAPATMDSGAALEVRGQSRNLSMMLVLKNKKRDIDFVKPRENYSREMQNTSY